MKTHFDRYLGVGLVCGLCSLLGYWLELSLPIPLDVSFSHFFIILAAISAGPEAALLAFSLGSLPITIFQDTGINLLVQSAVVVGALLLHAKLLPRQARYITTLLAWTLILIPLRIFATDLIWPTSIAPSALGVQCLVDVFLTACASTFLYLPWVCEVVLNKPYQPNREQLLTSTLATVFSFTAICAFFISPQNANLAGFGLEVPLALTILVVSLSWIFAQWTDSVVEELSTHAQSSRLSGSVIITDSNHAMANKQRQRQVRAEEEMAVSELPPAPVVSTPGVCATEADGKVIFMNDRFRSLTQLTSQKISSATIYELEMEKEVQIRLRETFEQLTEGENKAFEVRVNELPDSLRFMSVTIEPHVIEKGQNGFLITVQEITDRRTVENHLFEVQKMKNLGSVIGSIAHAFNNSLTAIIGRASFALHTKDSTTHRIALEEIRDHSQKSAELVWKLLEFSEGKPSEFEVLSLQALLADQIDLLQKLVGDQFDICVDCKTDAPLIKGDNNLMMQVLTELVTNAREAYRNNVGSIEVCIDTETMDTDIASLYTGARAGEYVRLTVKDTGCGMSAEMLSQAFAPLISTKEHSAGHSGFGLSIVYAIVRAHDGFISVESFPERGTTISLYLPLATDKLAPVGVEPADSATAELDETVSKDAEILVVEDEPNIRELIGKMLEMLGYQVSTCSNADEATACCEGKDFDLIIADYMMPQKSGLELIRELKEKKDNKATFILMSGYGPASVRNSASASVPLLTKPFDIEMLGKSVQAALTELPKN